MVKLEEERVELLKKVQKKRFDPTEKQINSAFTDFVIDPIVQDDAN